MAGSGRGPDVPIPVYMGDPGIMDMPNAVPVPFRPNPEDLESNGSLQQRVDLYEYYEMQRLMLSYQQSTILPCQYNPNHWVMPAVLEVHEKILCPDRRKALVTESRIPEVLKKKTEEALSRVKPNRIFGTGCGKIGISIWNLREWRLGLDIPGKEAQEVKAEEELKKDDGKMEKATVEVKEAQRHTKPVDNRPGFDWMKKQMSIGVPGCLLNSYPAHLQTKRERKERKKTDAKEFMQNLANEENMKKKRKDCERLRREFGECGFSNASGRAVDSSDGDSS